MINGCFDSIEAGWSADHLDAPGHIGTLLTEGIIKEGQEEGGREEHVYFLLVGLCSVFFLH